MDEIMKKLEELKAESDRQIKVIEAQEKELARIEAELKALAEAV